MKAGATTESKVGLDAELLTSYGLFIAVAALLVALFAAPMFRVGSVQVTGDRAARSEVASAANVLGANIFTIRAASVLNAVGRVPNVLPCGVTLAAPSSVTICVRARRPVLGWRTATALYLVDKFGRLIAAAASTSLPTVRDTTRIRRAVGQYVNPWDVESARWALAQMPRAAVDGFTLGRKEGMTIRSAHGWKAVLGRIGTSAMLRHRVAQLKALIGLGFKHGHTLAFADLTRSQTVVRWHGVTTPGSGY